MDKFSRSGALAAAALVTALALSACGSDEPAVEKAPAAGSSSGRTASPGDGGKGGSGGADAAALEGTLSRTDLSELPTGLPEIPAP
ncbi:hypothetical protein C5F59_021040 [Streptomyces sp. QL37]|uniref:hypothetical protein n=1 Tax=Streptomyces sp. QL37 TaxID=2093747 RepID=UPI000CF2E20A|nr:hypothetical protein [Streptomyces sp. QL37]PPQ58263.1 hypothetical protein C5F59_17450 [Streptomyces sp. QL37]